MHMSSSDEDWIRRAMVSSYLRTGASGPGDGWFHIRASAPTWFPELTGEIDASPNEPVADGPLTLEISEPFDDSGPPVIAAREGRDLVSRPIPPFDVLSPGRVVETPHAPMRLNLTFAQWFGRDRVVSVQLRNGGVESLTPMALPDADVEVTIPYVTYLSVRTGALDWRTAVASEGASIGGTPSTLLAAVGLVSQLERTQPQLDPTTATTLARLCSAITRFELQEQGSLAHFIGASAERPLSILRIDTATIIERWGLRRAVLDLSLESGTTVLWSHSPKTSAQWILNQQAEIGAVRSVRASGTSESVGGAARSELESIARRATDLRP